MWNSCPPFGVKSLYLQPQSAWYPPMCSIITQKCTARWGYGFRIFSAIILGGEKDYNEDYVWGGKAQKRLTMK